ncbi:hypothetical protein [Burkholderia sp. YIM B11467]
MRARIQSAVVEGKDSLLSLLSRLLSWQVSERRRACEHLHFQPTVQPIVNMVALAAIEANRVAST